MEGSRSYIFICFTFWCFWCFWCRGHPFLLLVTVSAIVANFEFDIIRIGRGMGVLPRPWFCHACFLVDRSAHRTASVFLLTAQREVCDPFIIPDEDVIVNQPTKWSFLGEPHFSSCQLKKKIWTNLITMFWANIIESRYCNTLPTHQMASWYRSLTVRKIIRSQILIIYRLHLLRITDNKSDH